MKCKICNTENQACFTAKLMGKYDVKYFHCDNCDFIQMEEPYWLEEAYTRPINLSDTGYMVRNLFFVKRLSIFLYLVFGQEGRFLDYAGGYGVFVRLMRDVGFDFYWDDKYTKNIFSVGFEWDGVSKIDAITAFEAFEHFVEPMVEIESLLEISNTLVFSTELHDDPVPEPNDWWYYGLDHGQHISFYSEYTFKYISKKFGLNYYRLGSLHMLTDKVIPKWKVFILHLSRFGLHSLVYKRYRSKTWDDHLKMSKVNH